MREAKEEVRERIDVAELISGYLELKPSGMGSFKALCPFHGERTPSFHVSTDKQIWHCFGCNKGGDIFAFVMEMEGVDFVGALKLLAQKAGVELPEYQRGQKKEDSASLEINDLAAKLYEKMLGHASGEIGRNYLKKRGIGEDLQRLFKLGFAPDSWDFAKNWFDKQGYKEGQLEKAGIVKPRSKGDGTVDRFRNRLMVPLSDHQGRVVGFTGRILSEDTKAPKYLNSPETDIYHKGKLLYGLHLAKTAIRTHKRAVIVEGNLDVIASHKAGVQEVVASSGTALTEDQLKLLQRLTSTIVFSFDGDAAGFAAARKGIHLAQNLGMDVQVIRIPEELGKDPDDVVQKNPEAWKKLVEKPVHVMEFYIEQGRKRFDLSNPIDKREFGRDVLTEIKRISSRIEQEHWLQRLSDLIHVDTSELRKIVAGGAAPTQNRQSRQPQQAPVVRQQKDQTELATELLLGILAAFGEEYQDQILQNLNEDWLSDEWKSVYNQLKNVYNDPSSSSEAQKTQLRPGIIRAEELAHTLKADQVRKEIDDHILLLRDNYLSKQRMRLQSAIKDAEQRGATDELEKLIQEYSSLLKN